MGGSSGKYQARQKIGNWNLEEPIGQGGQGQVWKVRHLREKHCGAKALKICTSTDTKARERFAREIEILQSLSHPHIVAVFDHGAYEGAPFFVMDLAEATLDRVVNVDTPGIRVLRESFVLLFDFYKQVCAAVAHMHQNDVLHRDIKPSNMLLFLNVRDPMCARVSDLGIAAILERQGQLTGSMELLGSPTYRAPEVGVPQNHTTASDVYSLGKTLEFLLIRGLPPAIGPGHCSRGPWGSNELWDSLDDILDKACAFDPRGRYRDAGDLLKALPELIVAPVGASLPRHVPVGDIILDPAQTQLLVGLIGSCPTDSDSASTYDLSKRAGVGEFQFAMALRVLRRLDFVESEKQEDMNGNTWESLRPTAAGFDWAHANPDAVANALPKKKRSRGDHGSSPPADDDIPF